jgi:DNA-directed RNA polymerase specialized sigma24 family protein
MTPQPGDAEDLEQAAMVFTSLRPRMFGIAYRMLGSAPEAEDLVQEAWLRWQMCDRNVRRETYIGPWLPEPVDTSADPYVRAERTEALGLAVLLLMDRLTPNLRTAYVLREAFDYPYEQIADILQSTEPAARQLVSRARKHMASGRRIPASAAGPGQRASHSR